MRQQKRNAVEAWLCQASKHASRAREKPRSPVSSSNCNEGPEALGNKERLLAGAHGTPSKQNLTTNPEKLAAHRQLFQRNRLRRCCSTPRGRARARTAGRIPRRPKTVKATDRKQMSCWSPLGNKGMNLVIFLLGYQIRNGSSRGPSISRSLIKKQANGWASGILDISSEVGLSTPERHHGHVSTVSRTFSLCHALLKEAKRDV